MKSLRNLVFAPLLILAGCNPEYVTKRELSDLMHEGGKVVETMYSKGHDLLDVPDIPETWSVVFRRDNGNKFAIQGSEPRDKVLWEKLDLGMEVVIDYKEIRLNRYKDIKGDGVRTLVDSVAVDYKFIDANPKQK